MVFLTPRVGEFRDTSSDLVTVSSVHDISDSSVSCNALDLECVADGSCRYEAVITYRCFGRNSLILQKFTDMFCRVLVGKNHVRVCYVITLALSLMSDTLPFRNQ